MQWHCPQYAVIGLQVLRRLPLRTLDLCFEKVWSDCRGYSCCDLILQIEHVGQRAVEPVSPDMRAGRCFDELAGDAHPRSRLADAAFEHISDAEFLADQTNIDRTPLVGERRVA